MKKHFYKLLTLTVLFSLPLFTACGPDKPEEPASNPYADNINYWDASDSPYGICINKANGDIILLSDGGFRATGDCYVYDNQLKRRMIALEMGMLPSKAVALDDDHLLVLNEGLWGNNDASLSYVDVSNHSAINDWFSSNNGRGLGDVGQDLIIYGSRAYVTVSFSNSVEIINTRSGLSTRLATTSSNVQTPRYMAADGGNVYVTCYSPISVMRIDTAQQAVTGICHLGAFHPEGICALNGKLYVSSSNISDEHSNYYYDNKVYVIDEASFSVVDSINVGKNPSKVLALDNSHIVVNTLGDYATDMGGTYIVDITSKTVTPLSVSLYNFDVYGGKIYGYTSPYGTLKFYRIDGNSLNAEEILRRAK